MLPRALFLVAMAMLLSAAPPAGRWTRILEQVGVKDLGVARAMEEVKRRDFLPADMKPFELSDQSLPIGYGEKMAAPSLSARMLEELDLEPGCKVLEVGTGAGYQTALLSKLCNEVYSIESQGPLAASAQRKLADLDFTNVHVKASDGRLGWPTAAPFDGIVINATLPKIPERLIDQLWPGGRIVMPKDATTLTVLELKVSGELVRTDVPIFNRPSF
jgi:protein-L-isoaspartate(D-aspartate) O-methyltransferase